MFDWDNLAKNIEEDALTDGAKKGYEEDSRFYKLSKDKNGNGGALIRFVPDKDGIPFIKMIKINADRGVNNRFCKDWSPQSIGKPDPFNEKFVELWKAGKKEEAKKFGRTIRYISNIKVIKDPANPDNEGKFFLLDMSKSLFDKIKQAVQPTEDEIALGTEPKAVFNPIEGNSMLLKIKLGANGIYTYEDSKFAEKVDGIYKDEAEAKADIEANSYSLKEFHKPEFFKSYEELKQCLNWFMGIENAPEETKSEPEKTKSEEIDVSQLDTGMSKAEPEPEKVEETKPEKKSKPEPEPEDDDLDALLADM
jgi:hypothetical protein